MLAAIAIAALLLVLLWIAGTVLLTLFAGVLVGILLGGLGHWLSQHSPLSEGWALAVVSIALATFIGGGLWLLAPNITGQWDQLGSSLTTAADRIRTFLSQHGWGGAILDSLSPQDLTADLRSIVNRILGFAYSFIGAIGSIAIILFIGIYTAASPDLYKTGIVRLVPLRHRPRAAEVLEETAHMLRRWLLGRFISMLVVGAMTAIGLWLLGMPWALALGVLTGLLDFIPYIGPIIAGALALLAAFAQGSSQLFYVFLLYFAVQMIESYLVTPLVQQRAVLMPPALLLSVQVLLGVFFGIAGLALATPLAVVGLVVTKMVYIHDILGDRSDEEVPRK
jgi:predicted PurR-regulated permease PerM